VTGIEWFVYSANGLSYTDLQDVGFLPKS